MNTESDLMQRLAVSKKIMDKHGEIKRGDSRPISPEIQEFNQPQGSYNIPQEYLSESNMQSTTQNYDPSSPISEDRIKNSKLPDEIKRLMIEKPIVQPKMTGPSISEEVIAGAQRLMNKGNTPKNNGTKQQQITTTNFNTNEDLKNMIRETVRDVVRDTVRDVVRDELKQSGMIVESTNNANEVIQFKVGNTVFVGKVTKIKKLEK